MTSTAAPRATDARVPRPSPSHASGETARASSAADSPNLDVLRAVAVLFVVVDHSLKFFGVPSIGPIDMNALGRLGVYFFFVHTSLVLMRSLDRQAERHGSRRLATSFYIRRAMRIYPLSLAVVGVVILAGIPAQRIAGPYSLERAATTGREIVANLLLAQDLLQTSDIIGVLWSLPLELRMYLLLPPLYFFWRRYRSPWPIVAFWALSAGWVAAKLPLSWFSVAPYVPCFLPGVLAFALADRVRPRLPAVTWGPILAGLCTLYFVLPRAPATNWLVCLLLGLSIPLVRDVTTGWLRVGAYQLAKYSYGIYLLHLLCLWLVPGHLPSWPIAAQVALYVPTVAVLSVLGFRLIEHPCVRLGGRLADRWMARTRAGTPLLPTRA